ncbi:hypothetical protein NQ314_008357 [Rhamnusium bicolor]|uniref:Uncharacterized protein n=1 Tax=Rhamnusium bicolor TaxID=1586634 RepID=A0AAV8YC51_9CUCU|nr:hypothetical protein NQ314_008357 [Rhamnusium bicolor]
MEISQYQKDPSSTSPTIIDMDGALYSWDRLHNDKYGSRVLSLWIS